MGVLVRGGTGAGCFPFDTGGVGSELAWVVLGAVHACMAGLAGLLIVWSFWIAELMIVSVLFKISSMQAVLSSTGLLGVSDTLVPWKWTVRLLRYTQQFHLTAYLTSFPSYCPVPVSVCRLSMYSLSRNLAVRSSSETSLLSSK